MTRFPTTAAALLALGACALSPASGAAFFHGKYTVTYFSGPNHTESDQVCVAFVHTGGVAGFREQAERGLRASSRRISAATSRWTQGIVRFYAAYDKGLSVLNHFATMTGTTGAGGFDQWDRSVFPARADRRRHDPDREGLRMRNLLKLSALVFALLHIRRGRESVRRRHGRPSTSPARTTSGRSASAWFSSIRAPSRASRTAEPGAANVDPSEGGNFIYDNGVTALYGTFNNGFDAVTHYATIADFKTGAGGFSMWFTGTRAADADPGRNDRDG